MPMHYPNLVIETNTPTRVVFKYDPAKVPVFAQAHNNTVCTVTTAENIQWLARRMKYAQDRMYEFASGQTTLRHWNPRIIEESPDGRWSIRCLEGYRMSIYGIENQEEIHLAYRGVEALAEELKKYGNA